MNKPIFTFGEFELDTGRRLLTRRAERVRLGSRAIDILIALLERPGVMVGAGQLTQQIWPNTFVDETNLRVHIYALRKALGSSEQDADFIQNLPGEGYRFTAPVNVRRAHPGTDSENIFRAPPLLTKLIGRDPTIRDLISDLPQHRLLTLVGPPGIGKTSVAMAVGNCVAEEYDNGVCFVDLTSIATDGQIAIAVASALHLAPTSDEISDSLLAFLADRHLLLILDNCEHHLDETASLVESILRGSPKVAVLATSREPLGANGEWLRRLKPLDSPQLTNGSLPLRDALEYSAIQLFVERAQGNSNSFVVSESEIPSIAELCRQLDGLPLAIELAAARVDTLAVTDIAQQLRTSLDLLSRGRRTAQARHRTLAAALDWSYELLPETEKRIFASLGGFQSPFGRQAALAIASEGELSGLAVLDGLAELAAKSLVLLEPSSEGPSYRLLETTRTYAREKLAAESHVSLVRRRHAEFLRDDQTTSGMSLGSPEDGTRDYRPLIDELRSALRWCFSPDGDGLLGISLGVTLASKWYAVTLFLEFATEIQQTFERLKQRGELDDFTEIQLLLAFIPALYNTRGSTPELKKVLDRAFTVAREEMDSDRSIRLQLLKELWLYHHGAGEHNLALAATDEFERLLDGQHDRTLRLQRMRAMTFLYRGELDNARTNLEVVLAHPPSQMVTDRGLYEYDPQVVALVVHARTLWLQGFPSQARQAADTCVKAAIEARHPTSICFALSLAGCPIALWCGDRIGAEICLQQLREQAGICPLAYWQQFGDVYEMALSPFRDLKKHWHARHREEASVLEGGSIAAELLQQALSGEPHWFTPELLRREALRLVADSAAGTPEDAKALLRRSFEIAQSSGAGSWQLRIATTMARVFDHEKPEVRHKRLQIIVESYSEGYDTADYMAALTVLSELEDQIAKIMHVS
jgi:predicted ATPase/DNA-binding winged helix-turn-helix (wHTH) protein